VDYPVHHSGLDFSARMTVVRLEDGRLLLQSPCEIDECSARQLCASGTPASIIAHGQNIDRDAVAVARQAWKWPLSWSS